MKKQVILPIETKIHTTSFHAQSFLISRKRTKSFCGEVFVLCWFKIIWEFCGGISFAILTVASCRQQKSHTDSVCDFCYISM